MNDDHLCPSEDAAGVRCCYGPGHECGCSFRPMRLSAAQIEMLGEVGRFPVRRFQAISRGDLSSARALIRRGLARGCWVSSRAWDCWLTPAGRRFLEDLPR